MANRLIGKDIRSQSKTRHSKKNGLVFFSVPIYKRLAKAFCSAPRQNPFGGEREAAPLPGGASQMVGKAGEDITAESI